MRYEVQLSPRALPQFLVARDGVVTHATHKLWWALAQPVPDVIQRLNRVHALITPLAPDCRLTSSVEWLTPETDDELD